MSKGLSVEVDQSGKIGDTGTKTVLAFSNHISFSIVIPARVKREVLAWLRRHHKSTAHSYIRFFAAGLYLLFQEYIAQISHLTIDLEYPGHDQTIQSFLIEYFKRVRINLSGDKIIFRRIGKHSRAHECALSVYQGARKPDRVIRTKELIALLQ